LRLKGALSKVTNGIAPKFLKVLVNSSTEELKRRAGDLFFRCLAVWLELENGKCRLSVFGHMTPRRGEVT
jgi:hypothetical protein